MFTFIRFPYRGKQRRNRKPKEPGSLAGSQNDRLLNYFHQFASARFVARFNEHGTDGMYAIRCFLSQRAHCSRLVETWVRHPMKPELFRSPFLSIMNDDLRAFGVEWIAG